ncbi:MAG: hypothetical protein P4K93_09815 [Terracidiphilus sp.]|nr:hypothetical protein [Terracidiphilus sp.]
MMRVLPDASLLYVVLRVLQTVNQPPYFCLNFLCSGEKMGRIHGGALPASKLCIHSFWRFSPDLIFEPAVALPGAYFHHSTHCENALAALFAGVVYSLDPLAGIHSARLLHSSGDAISYMSNRRTQSTLNDLNCLAMFLCSTASLLYPCRGGPRQPLDRQL